MKRTLVFLALVFLAASTANLLAAILLFKPFTGLWPAPPIRNEFGAEAAAHPWPARGPHAQPWPPMTQWVLYREFGRWQINATHAENGKTTHQMTAYAYGWPLTVMQETMRWWPAQDPAWTTSAPMDEGLRLRAGLLLNPLLVTLAVWLVCLAPFVVVRAITRRYRLKRGQCPACGYPMGVSDRCTECGVVLPKRAGT